MHGGGFPRGRWRTPSPCRRSLSRIISSRSSPRPAPEPAVSWSAKSSSSTTCPAGKTSQTVLSPTQPGRRDPGLTGSRSVLPLDDSPTVLPGRRGRGFKSSHPDQWNALSDAHRGRRAAWRDDVQPCNVKPEPLGPNCSVRKPSGQQRDRLRRLGMTEFLITMSPR